MKCDAQVTRFVHRPYRVPEKGYRVTEDQDYDFTRCYRVFVARGTAEARKLVDVVALADRDCPSGHRSFQVVRTFSFGAEDDLDRYLLWLFEESLIDSFGNRPQLVVAEQWSVTAQEELSAKNLRTAFIHPGRLDEWGVLSGDTARKGDLSMY